MKTSLCYTYCTLLIVSLVSSGLLFMLVASEATKPLNHLQSNDAQPEQHHSPLVQQERDQQPVELGGTGKAPPDTAQVVQNGKRKSKGRESESGFAGGGGGGGGIVVQSSDHSKPKGGGVKVGEGGNKKRHGLGKTSARRTSKSQKRDILTEKPTKLEEPPDLKEVIFLDALSKNSGVTNSGLQDIPGTPSVITLVDHQANELNIESRLEENIEATLKNISHQLVSSPVDEPEEQQATLDQQQQPEEEELPEDATNAQVAPEQAASLEEKIQDTGGGEAVKEEQPEVVQQVVPNVTFDSQHVGTTAEENPMPVFSEWAQKQMAEAEKKQGENVNASAMKRNSKPPGNKMPPLKLRAKNYAAPDCGAKIIASNPEAQSTGSVLTSHKDEYLLNPCTSKIWFVVELCEPIQAERVELANFELFSSSPKEFSVSVSNRFPTREWSNVGQFTAKDERDVQSFNLHPHLFGKFVRVEIHSHYNSEHYCPVSLFRVYGTSEFEAFETDNTPSLAEDGEEEDDGELTIEGLNLIEDLLGSEENVDGGDAARNKKANILKSAGEAVMNIVKKAAEALGKTNENDSLRNGTESLNGSIGDNQLGSIGVVPPQHPLYCFSLAFQPLCVSCPPELRNRLERTLNCKYNLLTSLLSIKSISTSFDETQHLLCANFLGFNLKREQVSGSYNIERSVLSWLPADMLASFCNLQAYEQGMIETRVKPADTSVKKPERPMSTEPPSTTQADKDEPLNDTDDQPTLSVIPSVTAPVTEELSSQPPPDQEQLPSPSLDDVNMFNVGVTAPLDSDPVAARNTEQPSETIPTTSTTTTATVGDSAQERDDSGLLDQQNSGSSMEELDNLLLEQQMEGLAAGSGSIPTITTTSTTTPTPGVPATQKGQPESVFLRLSNRIKALERNMSLSGQYLEELSRRYRKQVEELQHSYAKTLHDIEEQNRRMRDSEAQLREENERLREDFLSFRDTILSWKNIALAVGGFLAVQVVVVYAMMKVCSSRLRRVDHDGIAIELEHIGDQKPPIKGKLLRRRSIDGMIGASDEKSVGSLKKKRPSEEALNISGTYENLLIAENGGGDSAKVERKKKNKQRKISAPNMVQQSNGNGKVKRASSVEPSPVGKITKAELVRTESAPEPRRHSPEKPKPDENNRIEELPLLEDNDEFIIPTAMDLSYNEFVPDSTSETVNQTNGMISSSSSIDSKSTNKSGKGRRLSSPAFFKSSLLRSGRKPSGKKSTASQNVSSASSNTSSTGSSNVRININVHNVNRTEDELSSLPTDDVATSALNTPVSHQHSWEWYKLKKSSSQDKFTKRKSKSESPEVETTRHNGSINNGSDAHRMRTSVSFNGSTGSSEKKIGGSGGGSFRRLFRKVF